MNAIKFIQQHGVDKAREVVEGAPEGATSIIGEMYFRFTDKEYWYWSFSGCKSKGKSEQYFYYKKRTIYLSDLKRLVESIYLVKEHHTLDRAIEYANSPYTAPEIKVCLLDAIADYKSIYGGEHV